MRFEFGVVGKHPIGGSGDMRKHTIEMWFGSGVVGGHPVGILGAGCCRHGVCAQIGVGAIATVAVWSNGRIICNLYSELLLRTQKHRERLYLPNDSAWGYSSLTAAQPKY